MAENSEIIIFGSTEGTGSQVVAQALELGHDVIASARSLEKFDRKHEKLQAIKGNVLDFDSVERATQGHDVV